VDSVNERLWVVHIAPSKTPKTLGDRHVNGLSLIRHCTVLDWEFEFNRAQETEDVVTHRSLWGNRPCLYGANHSSSDAGQVGTTEVLVCIWDD